MKLNVNHGRILFHSLRALYSFAEVTSGAYKERLAHRGVDLDDPHHEELLKEAEVAPDMPSIDKPYVNYEGGILFRPQSDNEKRKGSLECMNRHIKIVQDCLDAEGLM